MTTNILDRQNSESDLNGMAVESMTQIREAIGAEPIREPFFVELVGDYEFKLLLGLAPKHGCVQYGRKDGDPPYMMALSSDQTDVPESIEFLIGDTPSPISRRYLLLIDDVYEIANHFLESRNRTSNAKWEEI